MKVKLGRVYFNLSYVVDMNNQEMVEQAKETIYEDIMSALKYNEIDSYIDLKLDKKAKVKDIPEFLTLDIT